MKIEKCSGALFLYHYPGESSTANVTFSILFQTTPRGGCCAGRDGGDARAAAGGRPLHVDQPAQPQHCDRGGEDASGEDQIRQSPGLCQQSEFEMLKC